MYILPLRKGLSGGNHTYLRSPGKNSKDCGEIKQARPQSNTDLTSK